jgi:DNA-binding NarL/FixJ family response regulator
MTELVSICVAVSVSLATSAAAFVYLLRAMRLSGADYDRRFEEATGQLDAVAKELGECRRRLTESEQRYSPVAETMSVPASLHLNRRGQVAQLFRRGQSPRSIASTLGMSQGEVKLMIKMMDLDPVSESATRQGKS